MKVLLKVSGLASKSEDAETLSFVLFLGRIEEKQALLVVVPSYHDHSFVLLIMQVSFLALRDQSQ